MEHTKSVPVQKRAYPFFIEFYYRIIKALIDAVFVDLYKRAADNTFQLFAARRICDMISYIEIVLASEKNVPLLTAGLGAFVRHTFKFTAISKSYQLHRLVPLSFFK